MKKANHQANIVRISQIEKHPNADTLEIIKIGEYQVVSKIGQFSVGDLAVYVTPDSIVPQTEPFKFIWQPYFDDIQNDPTKCKHEGSVLYHGDKSVCVKCHLSDPFEVPEKKRRITVRKFRKEWSEGLLLPITDFPELMGIQTGSHSYQGPLKERDDVSDLLGITHYDPDAGKEDGEPNHAPKLRKKYPKSLRGWYNYLVRRIRNFFRIGPATDGSSDNISLGIPVYDVDAYKSRPADFVEGEPVRISEKIHGSNARFIFLDGVMYVGSRNLWKSPSSNCIFRKALRELPWIEEWCKAHPGYVLWGEITPTQKGYEYGSKDVQFFVFDVYTPEGKWLDESTPEGVETLTHLQAHTVPVLYKGPYQGYDYVKTLVDGQSTVAGSKNIREGVVVATTSRNGNRSQRKIVSNVFLDKDNK